LFNLYLQQVKIENEQRRVQEAAAAAAAAAQAAAAAAYNSQNAAQSHNGLNGNGMISKQNAVVIYYTHFSLILGYCSVF
jgi:hypothetical protein